MLEQAWVPQDCELWVAYEFVGVAGGKLGGLSGIKKW